MDTLELKLWTVVSHLVGAGSLQQQVFLTAEPPLQSRAAHFKCLLLGLHSVEFVLMLAWQQAALAMSSIRVGNGKHREVRRETNKTGFEPRQANRRPLCEDGAHGLAFASTMGRSTLWILGDPGSFYV